MGKWMFFGIDLMGNVEIIVIELPIGENMRGTCVKCGTPDRFKKFHNQLFRCEKCGQNYFVGWRVVGYTKGSVELCEINGVKK